MWYVCCNFSILYIYLCNCGFEVVFVLDLLIEWQVSMRANWHVSRGEHAKKCFKFFHIHPLDIAVEGFDNTSVVRNCILRFLVTEPFCILKWVIITYSVNLIFGCSNRKVITITLCIQYWLLHTKHCPDTP